MKNGQEKYDVKLGIHEWKRYPEYKDSEVEWIREIPKEWNIKPLKQVTEFISRGNGPDYVDQSSIQVINQACIHWDGLNLENVKYQREINVSKWKGLLQRGDLLINSTGTGTLGRSSIFNLNGTFIADSHVTIVRSIENNIHPCYLFYLIQTPIYQGFIYSALVSGSTNQIELSREGLRSIPVVIPSIPEQKCVATFLDHETFKIDTLVQKKQRFIELLEEKCSALISHVVTKGLDPDVEINYSGVEWIGEIPEHWNISQLKFCYDVQLGKMLQNGPSSANDTLEPYLRAANINWNGVDITDIKEMWFGFQEKKKYILEIGDLLVSEGGDVGRSAIWQGELQNCYIQNAINRVRAKKGFSTKFLFYWMYSLKHSGLIDIICNKATIAHLTAEKLERILVPVISEREQQLIVDFLDHKTEKIDTLINKISAQIEKLKEYRTALISAAVTGKIDVREEVA